MRKEESTFKNSEFGRPVGTDGEFGVENDFYKKLRREHS